MNSVPVGLSDLAYYFPHQRMSLDELVRRRVEENPSLVPHLERAIKTTGQVSFRFPEVWEDPVTMASEALRSLLAQRNTDELAHLRFLTLGSETSVDMSKSGSNYVLGALAKAGWVLPSRLSSFQVQHACAGGSIAALTTAAYLSAAGRLQESSIVLTSDVARYAAPSTAEVTQGAGACALWITRNPTLLEFDLESSGFYSRDVDDFFRPLGSTIAKVRGKFSLACYNESFLAAFDDHCDRLGVDPATELESVDIFCLHVPYAQMPVGAMESLLALHLGLDQAQAHKFLEQRGFFASLEPASMVGNLYTGSLWLSLGWSLYERYQALGDDLIGRKVLLASYGSGNTMVVWTAKIVPQAPKVIQGWNFDTLHSPVSESDWPSYLSWLSTEKTPQNYAQLLDKNPAPSGRFRLSRLREDGYREYEV